MLLLTSPQDIRPAGWQLPKGGNTDTSEFITLDKAWGGDGTNRTNANTYSTFTGAYTSGNNGGFALAGYIYGSLDDVGLHGYYWSSTAGNNNYAYSLDLNSSNTYVGPQNFNYKYNGFSVRCVR